MRLRPGVAIYQCYFDPKKDAGIRVDGENVVEFPKRKEFLTVAIRASRVRSDTQTAQLVVRGKLVAEP